MSHTTSAVLIALVVVFATFSVPASAAKPQCVDSLQTDLTADRGEVIALIQTPAGRSVEYATKMREALYAFLGTAPEKGGLVAGVSSRGQPRWLDNDCIRKNPKYRSWMEQTLSGAAGPVLDDGLKVFKLNCEKAALANDSASSSFWDDCGVRPASEASTNDVEGAALTACRARVDKKIASAREQISLGGGVDRLEGILARLKKDLGPTSTEARECGAATAAALETMDAEGGAAVAAKESAGQAKCVATLRGQLDEARAKARHAAENPPLVRARGSAKPQAAADSVRAPFLSFKAALHDPSSFLQPAYAECGKAVDADIQATAQQVEAWILEADATQAESSISVCKRVVSFHFGVAMGVEKNDLNAFPAGLRDRLPQHPEDVERLGTVCAGAITATGANLDEDFGLMTAGQRGQYGVPAVLPFKQVAEIAGSMKDDSAGWVADAVSKRARVLERVKAAWIAEHVKGAGMLKVFRERAEPSQINPKGGQIEWVYGYVNDHLTYNTCDSYLFSAGGDLISHRGDYACPK